MKMTTNLRGKQLLIFQNVSTSLELHIILITITNKLQAFC